MLLVMISITDVGVLLWLRLRLYISSGIIKPYLVLISSYSTNSPSESGTELFLPSGM